MRPMIPAGRYGFASLTNVSNYGRIVGEQLVTSVEQCSAAVTFREA